MIVTATGIPIEQVHRDEISEARAALATARNDAREEAAKVAHPGEQPCDCIRCYCDNVGSAEAMAAWSASNYIYSAIRALKDRAP